MEYNKQIRITMKKLFFMFLLFGCKYSIAQLETSKRLNAILPAYSVGISARTLDEEMKIVASTFGTVDFDSCLQVIDNFSKSEAFEDKTAIYFSYATLAKYVKNDSTRKRLVNLALSGSLLEKNQIKSSNYSHSFIWTELIKLKRNDFDDNAKVKIVEILQKKIDLGSNLILMTGWLQINTAIPLLKELSQIKITNHSSELIKLRSNMALSRLGDRDAGKFVVDNYKKQEYNNLTKRVEYSSLLGIIKDQYFFYTKSPEILAYLITFLAKQDSVGRTGIESIDQAFYIRCNALEILEYKFYPTIKSWLIINGYYDKEYYNSCKKLYSKSTPKSILDDECKERSCDKHACKAAQAWILKNYDKKIPWDMESFY
jgi:hypothetical protein